MNHFCINNVYANSICIHSLLTIERLLSYTSRKTERKNSPILRESYHTLYIVYIFYFHFLHRITFGVKCVTSDGEGQKPSLYLLSLYEALSLKNVQIRNHNLSFSLVLFHSIPLLVIPRCSSYDSLIFLRISDSFISYRVRYLLHRHPEARRIHVLVPRKPGFFILQNDEIQ